MDQPGAYVFTCQKCQRRRRGEAGLTVAPETENEERNKVWQDEQLRKSGLRTHVGCLRAGKVQNEKYTEGGMKSVMSEQIHSAKRHADLP